MTQNVVLIKALGFTHHDTPIDAVGLDLFRGVFQRCPRDEEGAIQAEHLNHWLKTLLSGFPSPDGRFDAGFRYFDHRRCELRPNERNCYTLQYEGGDQNATPVD